MREISFKFASERSVSFIILNSNSSFFLSLFNLGELCEPNSDFQALKSVESLRARLSAAGYGADGEQPVKDTIASCGSGVTACYIALAIDEIGGDMSKVKVYDGSWSEYGLEGEIGGGDIEVGPGPEQV